MTFDEFAAKLFTRLGIDPTAPRGADASLHDDLLLDSIGMVELVEFLQTVGGQELSDDAVLDLVSLGDCYEWHRMFSELPGDSRSEASE